MPRCERPTTPTTTLTAFGSTVGPCGSGLRDERGDRGGDPPVVGAAPLAGRHASLELRQVVAPARVLTDRRLALLRRSTARIDARVARERGTAPLVQAAQVQRPLRAIHVDLEPVLPEDGTDLVDDATIGGGERRVVERRRFHRPQVPEQVPVVVAPQQPAAEVEDVAAEILEHAGARLAPRTEPVPDGAVAVDEPRAVGLADGAAVEQRLQALDEGLEAVVVRRVPDRPAARLALERLEVTPPAEQHGLLDEHRLAAAKEPAHVVRLVAVGDGEDDRIVAVGRHRVDGPVVGPGRLRVHGCDAAGAQEGGPPAAEISEPDHEVPHAPLPAPARSSRSSLAATSSAWTGTLPALSQETAAARLPSTLARTMSPDCASASGASARSASPAPIGSTSVPTKLSTMKNSRGSRPGLRYGSVPRSASFKMRYRHCASWNSRWASGRTPES